MIVRRLGKLWARMRDTVRNEPRDLEFQAELEEHVRLLAERYRRQGMTSEAAMLAARRQFGNTTLLQEDLRAMQIIPAIDSLRGDQRLWRSDTRRPGQGTTDRGPKRSCLRAGPAPGEQTPGAEKPMIVCRRGQARKAAASPGVRAEPGADRGRSTARRLPSPSLPGDDAASPLLGRR